MKCGNTGIVLLILLFFVTPAAAELMVTINSVTTPTNFPTQTITGGFTEDGSGINSITVNSITATISGNTYSADNVPLSEGSNTITTIATDDIGNTGTAITTIIRDSTDPAVAIDPVTTPTNLPTQTITGTFVEDGSGINSINVNGVSATISSNTYSAANTPLSEGSNTITVTATDNAGNTGTAITTIIRDSTGPTVTINKAAGQPDPTGTSTILFDVEFSERVDDFITGDVTLSGTAGAATAIVSGVTANDKKYTVTVSGMTSSGTVIASIAAGVAHNVLNYANTASTSSDNIVIYDATDPTVNLSSGTADPTNSLITVTATFSESVTGFISTDVSVTNGAVENFAGSGSDYTFDVNPTDGTGVSVTIDVPASSAQDTAGNSNTASNTLSYTSDTVSPETFIDITPPSLSNSNTATFSFHSSEEGSTIRCNLDGAGYTLCTSPKTYTGLTDGSHDFNVQALDPASNVDPSPAAFTWMIDTNPPYWSPPPSNQIVQVRVTFSYDVSATDASSIAYSINDTTNFTIDPVSGLITNKIGLSEGTYSLNITATDALGYSISQIITVTVQPEPTYSVSGYVFDNYNAGLVNVNIQNGTNQTNSNATGYYIITELLSGSYNLSYSKSGFNTNNKLINISGSDVKNANMTLFDTTPPGQVTGLSYITPTPTIANLSWSSTANASHYQIFRNSNLTGITQNTYWNDTGIEIGILYQYWVRANDSYNNWGQNSSNLSVRTSVSTTSPPSRGGGSSSSGGGGGGGGGTSGENFLNIIVKEKYDLFIYKDTVTSYKFKNINNPILTINIVGNVNAGEIGTSVEVLKNTSSLVKIPAPGNVYKNANIWVGTSGFGNSKNIKEAVITFRVESSWLSGNNIKTSSIKMVRWNGSKWDPVETSEKTKDSTYIYFEAKTDGFSSFAITGIENKDQVTETAYTRETLASDKPAATAKPEEKKSDFLTNWFMIIGVFFAIGLVIEMYIRMKKK